MLHQTIGPVFPPGTPVRVRTVGYKWYGTLVGITNDGVEITDYQGHRQHFSWRITRQVAQCPRPKWIADEPSEGGDAA